MILLVVALWIFAARRLLYICFAPLWPHIVRIGADSEEERTDVSGYVKVTPMKLTLAAFDAGILIAAAVALTQLI